MKQIAMESRSIIPNLRRLPALLTLLFSVGCGAQAATLTTLYSFDGTNGTAPEATLIFGGDGYLYGTTFGVSNGIGGTIFRISFDGTFSTLAALSPGQNIRAELLRTSDGTLYGVSYNGGENRGGSVFRVNDGAIAPISEFFASEGSGPNAVVQGRDGNLYGTTFSGGLIPGAQNVGTVFRLTPAGNRSILASFTGGNGSSPESGLRLGADGNFYGTTTAGGTNKGFGTVFKVSPAGTLTSLASFNGTNGSQPLAAPWRTADGALYGTTSAGGIDFNGSATTGNGTLYKLRGNTITTLVYFTGNNGAQPGFGGLTAGFDGRLYGTTQRGGAHLKGTIFQLTTSGALTTLFSFNGTNGSAPTGSLLQGPDGNFYGVTMSGGAHGAGTIFRLTPDTATNSARITLTSSSFSLGDGTNAGPRRVIFASSSGGSRHPFVTQPRGRNRPPVGNGEFQPDPAAGGVPDGSGAFVADYLVFDSDAGAVVEIGSISLVLPLVDSDTNAIPDLFDSAFTAGGTFTGTVSPTFTAGAPVTKTEIAGTFQRGPFTGAGFYTMDLFVDQPSVVTGALRVQQRFGKIDFGRKSAVLTFWSDADGTPTPMRAVTPFTLSGDALTLNRLALNVRGFRTPTPVTLQSDGTTFTSPVTFADGLPGTRWPDFRQWWLVVQQ